MKTKNSVVKIQNQVVNHESQTVKSNPTSFFIKVSASKISNMVSEKRVAEFSF